MYVISMCPPLNKED